MDSRNKSSEPSKAVMDHFLPQSLETHTSRIADAFAMRVTLNFSVRNLHNL
jgi:hypothetical protein